MPFDPTKPAFGSPDSSAEMRGQLNALNDKIDAIPAGPPGPQGPPFASAVVDGVSTLNPGDNATVSTSFDGNNVRFTFGIPRGADGTNGTNGTDGAQGPPFGNGVIDAVNTLGPGDPATVSVGFDGTSVRFTFGIPRGTNGTDGAQGPQGTPGEVTNAALASAIAGTSANTNAVATLDTAFTNNPLTLADGELLRAKINEIILNGRQ